MPRSDAVLVCAGPGGKLTDFQDFYNAHRAHAALDGRTPVLTPREVARLTHYRWEEHARGLYQTPIAA